MNEQDLTRPLEAATARIIAVQDDIVSIVAEPGQALTKNEVIYIIPTRSDAKHKERLKAEILRIHGNQADAQVYESTQGIGVGDPVIQTGEMLSVDLGPGLLGQVYDGLQNPLDELAGEFGYFLPRGIDLPALDGSTQWAFTPSVQAGTKVCASAVLGSVQERKFKHKILVPFDVPGEAEVSWIQEGSVTVDEPVAKIKLQSGKERLITLKQRWPVRVPIPQALMRKIS